MGDDIPKEHWAAFIRRGRRHGAPMDQIENYANARIVPFDRQWQFAAACREADKEDGPTEIAYGGGISGGKSAGALAQLGCDDCQRFPGLKALILRKIGKSNLENFNDQRMRLFGNLPHRFSKNGELVFENSSRILAGHYQNERDIDKYLGLEYDVILIEEATTLSAKKHEYIMTRCRTSKKGWRPRAYLTANPGGIGHHWFKTHFVMPYRRKEEKWTRYVHSIPTDNPYIEPSYKKRLELLVGWERRAWLLGDWDIAAGQFFTTFRQEIHVDPIARFDIRKIRSWWAAMDWGRIHPCVVLIGGADGDGNIYILWEHCQSLQLPKTHADAIKTMLAGIKWPGPTDSLSLSQLDGFAVGSDAFAEESDGGSVAKQFKAEGIDLSPANMERVNGWSEISDRLGDSEARDVAGNLTPIAPRLFIHPRCVKLVETIPMLQHDPKHPEDVLKWDVDEQGNGGDDPADAMRYLVYTKFRRVFQRKLTG